MNRFFAIVVVILVFVGCEKPFIDPYGGFEAVVIDPVGNENFLNNNSDFIFNQDSLYTFEIYLSDAALNYLDADPAAEEYVPAQLKFQGETISPIGVRYKGSIGSFAGCLSGEDVGTPSGRKVCTKLSMKIDFTRYQNKYKFYNLNKLQFHSMNHDKTQMHERLGYWLFREMGVPAPRCVHARVIVNGIFMGLYALVENVDEQFTKNHFEDGSGNLYKEVWPTNSNARAYSRGLYLDYLKTNMDASHTRLLIKDFGEEIQDSDQQELDSLIQKWMDIDEIIAYAVVDRAIKADDGPFHWYVHNARIYNHNYFWYEEPAVEKLHLIPYDLDNAFENIIQVNNSITAIADEWGESSHDCGTFDYMNSGKKQRSASCDKLTSGWMSFDEEYVRIRGEFFSGPFSESILTPLLDTWESQIYKATLDAAGFHNDAISELAWQQNMLALQESLEYARDGL